jgi:hypothetical protein
MRTRFCAIVLVLVAAVSSLVLAFSSGIYGWQSLNRSDEETGLPEAVLTSIKHRLREIGARESAWEDRLVRVTREPFPVARRIAAACAPATQALWDPQNPHNDPHDGQSIHVFVTSPGSDAMKAGKGLYPRGTVILKEKFADAAGAKPVLFTGMLKRDTGYNTEAGDWQFFVLNADATTVTIDNTRSCIHCHAPFRKTDYVARTYLKGTDVAHRP